MKYIGFAFILFLLLYGYVYYTIHYPSMLKSILIPSTRNTYFRIYEYSPLFDDTYDLYYDVVEDNQVVCSLNRLVYINVAMEPFVFDVDTIGNTAYISCCAYDNRIDATYNLTTKECKRYDEDISDSLLYIQKQRKLSTRVCQ